MQMVRKDGSREGAVEDASKTEVRRMKENENELQLRLTDYVT